MVCAMIFKLFRYTSLSSEMPDVSHRRLSLWDEFRLGARSNDNICMCLYAHGGSTESAETNI